VPSHCRQWDETALRLSPRVLFAMSPRNGESLCGSFPRTYHRPYCGGRALPPIRSFLWCICRRPFMSPLSMRRCCVGNRRRKRRLPWSRHAVVFNHALSCVRSRAAGTLCGTAIECCANPLETVTLHTRHSKDRWICVVGSTSVAEQHRLTHPPVTPTPTASESTSSLPLTTFQERCT